MIKLNSPKGLGDAIHTRAIARHFRSLNENVTVFTRWPDVFADLPGVTIRPAEEASAHRDMTDVRACFQCRVPYVRELSQFRNACLRAGIYENVDLEIGWKARNHALIEMVKQRSGGRPIMLYQPLKRAGNLDEEERRPDEGAFRRMVAGYPHYKVKIGHSSFVEDDKGLACDLDLFGKTSVLDAIDVVTIADLVCSEPSYLGILAQAFKKKFVCLFAVRGMESKVARVAGVTPQRIFHVPELCTAVFDG